MLLVLGGDWLVRGAASLAGAFKISPLVIGLTVVAFGTSAPELGVSLSAAISDNAGVAVGNVIGSNITNVLFVLGMAALVTPLVVSSELIRRDVPLMIGASVAFWAAAWDGKISRIEGGLMFAALGIYLFRCIKSSRQETQKAIEEFEDYAESVSGKRDLLINVGFLVIGLLGLAVGSELLVRGATTIARAMNVSNLVIGLTVVAIGTSLPEVVTSVVASLKGQRDIAVGNVVGSNLFNVLCVIGLTGVVAPGGIPVDPDAVRLHLPIMVAVAVICFPIFWTGKLIRRWEGGLFLTYYVAYTALIVLTAVDSSMTGEFKRASLVVVPATLVPIAISTFLTWKRRGESNA